MGFVRRAGRALTFSLVYRGILAAFLIGLCTAAQAQRAYTNIVNDRFATVSNGPQDALIVDVPASATSRQIQDATLKKAHAAFLAQARNLTPQMVAMERAGVLKPGSIFPLGQIVALRTNGRMVVPPKKTGRGVGGGSLTFKLTGFNETDNELINGFLSLALPRIEAIYGKPAVSGQVEIINAGNFSTSTLSEVRRFAYGVYNVSTNQIQLPIFQDPRGTLQALLLNLLFAFHGPAVLQYDAWEQGFARAAAAVVLRNPEFNTQYGMDDPSGNALYSLMRWYDILNQAPLANNTFFPPSQSDIPIDGQITVAKMLWARIGMSGAAWLKVFIENPNFFRDFNAAYYAQFTPGAQPSLAGNIPALKQIAASLLPGGVEGIAFNDWYARQYVLDTSISPGNKLYAFLIPGGFGSNGKQTHSLTLVYYRTEASGDETLLSGRAYGLYTDSTNKTVSFGAAAEQAALSDGEGGLTIVTTYTAGTDAQRLTLDFTAGNSVARTYLPVGFTGDFSGVLLAPLGANKVSVSETTIPPIIVRAQNDQAIEGAAFGVPLGLLPTDFGVVTVAVTDGTNTRTYKVNVAGDSYYAVLRDGVTGGGVISRTKTFASSIVPYLVSFPVQPQTTDVASALSLPGLDFLLSFWNPLQASYETYQPTAPSVASLQVGRAYWLKIAPESGAAQVVVSMTGMAPPTDTDLAVPCSFGWNMIGSPFGTPIDISTINVKYLQNDPITYQQAVDQNLIAAAPFTLNRDDGQYGTVSALSGTDWQGYWLRVLAPSGVTLLLPGPDAPTRAAKTRAAVPTATRNMHPDWQVRIAAQMEVSGRQSVSRGTFGIAPGATRGLDNRLDREEPPAVVPGVQLAFTSRELKAAGGRFTSDFHGTGDAQNSWTLQVAAPTDGPVTLIWDGLGNVSRRQSLLLVDSSTGERVSLRNRSAYSFTARAGVTRSFQILAERENTTPLLITNLMTASSRAAGREGSISISYSISRAADVHVALSTLTGKTVSSQNVSRAQAIGLQRVTLSGRAQNGSPLPPGPYFVTVSARDENGNETETRRVVTLLQ